MINNQRGGIISKMFLLPVGLALMAGSFFLGYSVGKYQTKTRPNEIVVPLPEVISKKFPKHEEFTFYKTLSDKGNTTVSIELKPRSSGKGAAGEKTSDREPVKSPEPKTAKKETKTEKTKTPPPAERHGPGQRTAKKDPEPASGQKIRYSLQIASYQDKDTAEADVKKMKQRGYAAFIVPSDLEGKGTWYRVWLGSFSSRAAAEKLQKELRTKEGISPFVTQE